MKTIEPDWQDVFGTLRAFENDQDSWGPVWAEEQEDILNSVEEGWSPESFEEFAEVKYKQVFGEVAV